MSQKEFFQQTVYEPLIAALCERVFPEIVEAANAAAEVNEPFTMERLLAVLDVKNIAPLKPKRQSSSSSRSSTKTVVPTVNHNAEEGICIWITTSGASAGKPCSKPERLFGYCTNHIKTVRAHNEINSRRMKNGEDTLSKEELEAMVPSIRGKKASSPVVSSTRFPSMKRTIPTNTKRGSKLENIRKFISDSPEETEDIEVDKEEDDTDIDEDDNSDFDNSKLEW